MLHLGVQSTSIETAKREIWEESGLNEIKLIKKLGVVKRPNSVIPDELKIIDLFLFTTSQEKLNSQEEHSEAKWFDMDEVIINLQTKEEKEFFERNREQIIEVS